MNIRSLFVIISLIASLGGCVTIRSNVSSEAVPPSFSRVLVVTKMRNAPDSYAQEYIKAFPAGYEICALALSPLSFGKPEELIKNRVEECRSDVILTLELVQTGQRGQSARYGSGQSGYPYEFNAEMKSVTTGQPFWKAIISSSVYNGEGVPPNAVVNRLLKDHILQGNSPTPYTRSAGR